MVLDDFIGPRCLTYEGRLQFDRDHNGPIHHVLGVDEDRFAFARKEMLCDLGEVRWRYESNRQGSVPYLRPTYSDWLTAVGHGHGHKCVNAQLDYIYKLRVSEILPALPALPAATFRHMVTFYRYVQKGCSLIYGISEEHATADLTVVEIGTARDDADKHTVFVFDVDLTGIKKPRAPRG